jgi:sugar lactone lactonase YvrE
LFNSTTNLFQVNGFHTADGSRFQSSMTSYWHTLHPRVYAPSMVYDPVRGTLLASGSLAGASSNDANAPFVHVVDTGGRVGNMAVDAEGNAYYARLGVLQRITDGAVTPTTIPAHSGLAIDTAGKFWVNGADDVAGKLTVRSEVKRYDADGAPLATVALPFPAVRLVSDGLGGVWVGDRPGGQVVRVAADGTVGAPLGVTANDFCVDANHNLWVAGGPSLLKLAPDGTELGNFPIKALTVTSGDGHVFAGTASSPAMVMKLIP